MLDQNRVISIWARFYCWSMAHTDHHVAPPLPAAAYHAASCSPAGGVAALRLADDPLAAACTARMAEWVSAVVIFERREEYVG